MKTTLFVILLVMSMTACVSKTPIEEKAPVEITAQKQTEIVMLPSIFEEKAFGEKSVCCLIDGVYRFDDGVCDACSIAMAITDFCDDL